jgi:hypothetical protein
MMQCAGRAGIHLVEKVEDPLNARFPFGGGLGLGHEPGRRGAWRLGRGGARFCHTENINVPRRKLLLIAAALAAFGLSLLGSFHFDDYSLLTGNVWRTLSTRPITALTFWFSVAAGDHNPADFHAINLALHVAAVLLLYDALRRLIGERAAFIGAAIFATHPIQAEAVNYIFERASELDTLLCLAALTAWLRGARWWAVAWFAAALGAKQECVAFPIFLALLSMSRFKRIEYRKPIAVMLALSIAAGVAVMLVAQRTPGSQAGAHAGVGPASYFLAQGPVIWRYFRLLIIPWGFNVDPQIAVPPVWVGVLAWVALIAAAAVATRRFFGARVGFWFIAGLILLLPSSSIFPAADLAADRRMYLPMIAFAACAGILLQGTRPAIVTAVALVLIGLSVQRTLVWRTEQSLWTDAIEKSPDKVRPKIQLARASDPARALQFLQQAQSLAPNDAAIDTEEGRVYLNLGKPAQALAAFGRALALQPNNADALNNRGAALLALGQRDAARQDFERALKANPCQAQARENLSRLGVATQAPANCE